MSNVDNFEWDDSKAVRNYIKHGIRFEEAIKAFRDRFAFERMDNREDYGEERINLIGMCNGLIIHITYTERGKNIRVISARKAKNHEREDYYRQNTQ